MPTFWPPSSMLAGYFLAAFVEAGGGVGAKLKLEFVGDSPEACGEICCVTVEGKGEAGVRGHEQWTVQEGDAIEMVRVDRN